MTKLKPCPFCGGRAIYALIGVVLEPKAYPSTAWEFQIRCERCGISSRNTYKERIDFNENA